MSHATDWTCRACRFVLGQVREGVLRPLVPVASVDGRGVTRVSCTRCGQVRVWIPANADPIATVGPSTLLLERGKAGRAPPGRTQ